MSEFQPFGPDSMMWTINRERLVLLAGPAAAVLQVAHPQVALGVAGHSRFRSDTMGRLQRTLDAVYTVAFGTAAEVARVRTGVRAAHDRVRGPGYSAADPDAVLWVLATLIMGSVNAYERFLGPLSPPDKNCFLTDYRTFGDVFGVDPAQVPSSWDDMEAYWKGMIGSGVLGSHPLCGEVARAVIAPEAPRWMRWASPLIRDLALEFIPRPLADRLGLPVSRTAAPTWRVLDALLPPLLPWMPGIMRHAPHYRSALRGRALTHQTTPR